MTDVAQIIAVGGSGANVRADGPDGAGTNAMEAGRVQFAGGASWQEAEEALLQAVEDLAALPDRERAFLAAGRRSQWPQVLRIEQSDYPDRPSPRRRLSAADLARLDQVLLGPDAWSLAIPEDARALVGRVLTAKLWPDAGGFRWRAVREAMQRASRDGARVPACEGLRKRYSRALTAVAKVMPAR